MKVEYMTESYLKSYNKALEMTKNPNLAAQTAMAVLMIEQMSSQQKAQANPLAALLMTTVNDLKKDANTDKKKRRMVNEHDEV